MIQTKALWDNQRWISLTDPDDSDITELLHKYEIPKSFIGYILDSKERARFDYDFKTDCGLFVFRIVNRMSANEAGSGRIQTTPLFVLLNGDFFITSAGTQTERVNAKMAEIVSADTDLQEHPTLLTLVLELLFELNQDYYDRINDLDSLREDLEGYTNRPSNEQIKQLSELSKSVIYLKAASSGNLVAVRQVQFMSDSDDDPIKLTREEQHWVKDLKTELEQTTEMAQVNGEIIQQVADTYSNLLDHSLNDTMRVMTIWSLALAVPPIISGFYGMNVKLPIIGGMFDWPFSILLSLIPVGLMIWYLRHNHDL